MTYYIPPCEKVGGHVPRVPHQSAPMCVMHYFAADIAFPLKLVSRIPIRLKYIRWQVNF